MDKSKSTVPKIGTHDGTFHCDEVLACYMLKKLPQYKDAEIVRTRDPEVLSTCDIVVDVGGEYDHRRKRYDHHQRSFNESMNSLNGSKPWKIKLSSAGLVYNHFGADILSKILNKPADSEVVKQAFHRVYENFVQEIDAIDNGVEMCTDPKYRITTNISSRVARLNPHWNSQNKNGTEGFYKAFTMVGKEFEERVLYIGEVWWPAKELIVEAVETRFKVHSSGQIITLPEGGVPWKEHLYAIEAQKCIQNIVKFVIFADSSGAWRVQAVPEESKSFVSRVPLLKEWCGLRDEELTKISGIDGCVFVHANGFIGGNKTFDGCIKMASKTLEKASAILLCEVCQNSQSSDIL